jgi:hypothetical protein
MSIVTEIIAQRVQFLGSKAEWRHDRHGSGTTSR